MSVCSKPGCLCPVNDEEECCPDCLTPNLHYKGLTLVEGNKQGRVIIARTYIGAMDMCYGIPDLEGATIIKHETNEKANYESKLTIVDKKGFEHTLIIKQDI